MDFSIGVRMATEEKPNFEFYTSRLGIRSSQLSVFMMKKLSLSQM